MNVSFFMSKLCYGNDIEVVLINCGMRWSLPFPRTASRGRAEQQVRDASDAGCRLTPLHNTPLDIDSKFCHHVEGHRAPPMRIS